MITLDLVPLTITTYIRSHNIWGTITLLVALQQHVEERCNVHFNVVKFYNIGGVVPATTEAEATAGQHSSAGEQAEGILLRSTAGGSMGRHDCTSKNVEKDYYEYGT